VLHAKFWVIRATLRVCRLLLSLNAFPFPLPPSPSRGLSLSLVQLFLRQLLDALMVLRDASIIHCDIKVR
jgi:dual specificity protein kinase YAK1